MDTDSNDTSRCVRCGVPYVPAATGGLCPQCVGRQLVSLAPSVEASSDRSNAPLLRLGDYEVLEKLAEGGMGIVFKARQAQLDRVVALKMIRTGRFASEAEIQRFHAEAEAAAQLNHPNIVPLYEVGEQEGRHYFTMELIEGQPLSALIKDGCWFNQYCPQHCPSLRFIPGGRGCCATAAALMAKVARAVHYAHQRGVLHRDLKPGNILVDRQGEPHVADFGLAKRIESPSDLTISGEIIGSPSYMAPEQAAGRMKQLTTAADIYSLGAVLYELLTGRAPFKAATPLETMRLVMETEPARPTAVNPRADGDLEVICLKCLEKDPARRYGSADAMARDLERWLANEPIQARPATTTERVVKWARRNPRVAVLAGLLHVVFLAGFLGILWQWREALRQEARANAHEAALRVALDEAWGGFVAKARALRLSGHSGWSEEAAVALDKAARHRKSVERLERAKGDRNSDADSSARQRQTIELRNEAAACLLRPDVISEGPFWPLPETAAGHTIAPDLEHYGVAHRNGDVTIHRFQDGSEARRLSAAEAGVPPGTNIVRGFRFSPDGRCVAVRYAAGEMRVFWWKDKASSPLGAPMPSSVTRADGQNGVRADEGLRAPFRAVAPAKSDAHPGWVCGFSADARWFVLLTASNTIQIYDLSGGGARRHEFSAAGVTALDCHPHEPQVAVAAGNQAQVLDWTSGKVLRWQPLRNNLVRLRFRPDGRQLALQGGQHEIVLWNLVTEDTLELEQPGQVWYLAYSQRGRFLSTVQTEGISRLWDTTTGRQALQTPHASIVQFGPGDTRVGFERADGVGVRPMAPAGALRYCRSRIKMEHAPLWTVDLSEDGRTVAAANDDFLHLWDLRSDQPAAIAPLTASRSVLFRPDRGRLRPREEGSAPRIADEGMRAPTARSGQAELISISRDGVRLWPLNPNPATARSLLGKPLHLPLVVGANYGYAAVSSDGAWLALGVSGREAWNLPLVPGSLPVALPFNACSPAFSPDGRWIAGGDLKRGKSPVIMEAATGRTVFEGTDALDAKLAVSPDGRWFVEGGAREYRVWATATWKKHLTIPREGRPYVRGPVAFAPDSSVLAIAPSVDTIRLLKPSSGEELLTMQAPEKHTLLWFDFDDTGHQLAAATLEGMVQVWDLGLIRGCLAELGLDWDSPKFPARTNALEHGRPSGDLTRGSVTNPPGLTGWTLNWPTNAAEREVSQPEPNLAQRPIDLTGHRNTPLTQSLHGAKTHDNSFAALPAGVTNLAGVDFDVRGLVRLASANRPHMPSRVAGIRVDQRARRLHFLHTASLDSKPGTTISRFQVHYADGRQQEIRVEYGRDVLHWRVKRTDPDPPGGPTVAWKGTNERSARENEFIRLFKTTWTNPFPDTVISHLDFESALTRSEPMLAAITAEGGARTPSSASPGNQSAVRADEGLRAPSGTNILLRVFPPRSPDATPQQLDLGPWLNKRLEEDWTPAAKVEDSFAAVPHGLQEFGGLKFDVRGLLLLEGRNSRGYGVQATKEALGIPVHAACRKLHFLLGVGWGFLAKPGDALAQVEVHYSNGATKTAPIRQCEEVADAWMREGSRTSHARSGKVVWRGTNETSRAAGATLQLHLWTWENPAPEDTIETLDIVSANTGASLFIVAITAE